MANLQDVFKFIKNSCWLDDCEDSQVFEAVDSFYNQFVFEKTKSKKIYRICGQAGSGKTSQVAVALHKFLQHKHFNPLMISVRFFAKLHPKYNEFLQEFGSCEIREKTNGFALKCLVVALERAIKDGYLIVLDLTLLDKVFEKFLYENLCKNSYEVEYHLLAVNKKISNYFISLRQKSNGLESGRIIYNSSRDYFYKTLSKSLKFLCNLDVKNYGYIWTAQQNKPVFKGKLKEIKKQFFKCRKNTVLPLLSAEEAMQQKVEFLIENF